MHQLCHRFYSKVFFLSIVLAGVLILRAIVPDAVALAEDRVSAPGEYSGYSQAQYDGDVRFSQYISMRDGTELAVDIYRPAMNGDVVEDPLPVVWMHSPYNRRYYPPSGPDLTVDLYPGGARALIKYGYIVAVVDARGLYASFGSAIGYNRGEWMPDALWDAYDITEWFAGQPWCDGKVGMWGCSATGETQLQAASTAPPHLVAVFPMSCAGDIYGTGSGVSGNTQEGLPAPEYPYWVEYNEIAAPVDDDPDGVKLAAARQEQMQGAEVGHVPYRDSISPWVKEILGLDVRWNLDSSPHTHFDRIEQSGVAMYSTANLEDGPVSRWGPIMRYKNLSNPAKLLLGPGGHCLWYTDYSPKPYPVTFPIVKEEHRWFDYWLKGIENGIMDEPPIYLFTYNQEKGKEWRFAWQWPLPNERRMNYYLGPQSADTASYAGVSGVNNGTLTTAAPVEKHAQDDYVVDYTITADNRDELGLTYTTEPLASDLEVTGDPVVNLYVSSTATDNDFFAYLEDVAPDGAIRYFSVDGSLRASNRAEHRSPYDNWGLPYHRSFERDAEPLTPGRPVSLSFNLGSTSYIFKAGHRIRLIITCYMPATPPSAASPGAPSPTPMLDPPPTVSIYRNRILKSHLVLPVADGPVRAKMFVKPGLDEGLLTAMVIFPKALEQGYIKDLDIQSVRLNGIAPVSGERIADRWIFKFKAIDYEETSEVKGPGGKHRWGKRRKVTMTGNFGARFNYGRLTFEARDIIEVK